MKQRMRWARIMIAMAGGLGIVSPATADTTITTFDDFYSDALYASWLTATIDAGPTAYSVTATNYGSNWRYLPVDASGETTVELTVTLSSSSTNEGKLGPIVTLEDADGTSLNYAWFGQTNGSYVLTMPIASPTWVGAAGSVAGLDLATLTHLHMQLDPSDYHGGYTIVWENLRLTGAPPSAITAYSFNPATTEFNLTWSSKPGKFYTVLYAATLTSSFDPLAADIPSGGTSTSVTVGMPTGDSGFLRIQEQQ
jgi:hypothetical protein